MSLVQTTRVTTKGQVVIPQKIREALGLSEGDEMIVARDGERVVMRKLHLGDILEEAAADRKAGKTVSHEAMISRYGV